MQNNISDSCAPQERMNPSFSQIHKKFSNAFIGMQQVMLRDSSVRLQLFISILVCAIAFLLEIEGQYILLLFLCCSLVISAEIFNTCIEQICNFIYPEQHAKIKFIKDSSAAAVFVLALASFVLGLYIFIPKILFLIH